MATFTKEQVMECFLTDMKGAPARALYSSFKKYSMLRDQLIDQYIEVTGIPRKEFMTAIAQETAEELRSTQWD